MVKLISKIALALSLLAVITFTACNKESDLTTETVENFVDQALFSLQEEGNLGRHGCFELVFPITVEFPDETTITVNDYEELATAITAWKEANPDADDRPTFVFPIEVLSEEGEVISVANAEELKALKEECGGNYFRRHGPKGHKGQCGVCFDLVFPLTIQFPDDTTAEANDREELKSIVREWKTNNPDADERPEIVFPIEVEMEDGTIVTVNSKEELKELKDNCD